MRPYLGEWVGDTWVSTDEPRTGNQRLRFWVEDGRVRGEAITQPPVGMEALKMTVTYLRVTAAGLTYGYLNGMRPRGVLLHEAAFVGDTLAGVIRFGGVRFRFEDGSVPPPINFLFRRVRP